MTERRITSNPAGLATLPSRARIRGGNRRSCCCVIGSGPVDFLLPLRFRCITLFLISLDLTSFFPAVAICLLRGRTGRRLSMGRFFWVRSAAVVFMKRAPTKATAAATWCVWRGGGGLKGNVYESRRRQGAGASRASLRVGSEAARASWVASAL